MTPVDVLVATIAGSIIAQDPSKTVTAAVETAWRIVAETVRFKPKD